MSYNRKYRMGWIPDYPDFRDYTSKDKTVLPMTSRLEKVKAAAVPSSVDLRKWCSPVEDQKDLGSCTAHAVSAVVEYFENKAFGKYINASRLFLYKTTRNLLHYKGDTGATLKGSIGALILFGVPPEEYWPYDTANFDIQPDSFCYAFGQNYRCISYFRHDPAGLAPVKVLESIKKYLASGIPSVFGFSVYQGIDKAAVSGKIPYPAPGEKLLGGHAVAAVGFDDAQKALLIQNSWGSEWGEKGFGWLPYDYVLKGLARDWWSMLKQDWVDTGLFTTED